MHASRGFRRAGVFAAAVLVTSGAGAADREPAGPPLSAAPPPAAKPAPVRPALPPRSAEEDAATYERCMKLAHTDPAAARDLAEGWQAKGGAHPADHCAAAALIGLKQYKAAAAKLEALAQAMEHAPVALRASVYEQAAEAWMLAGDPRRAYAVDGTALAMRPDDPDLLVDRAVAAGAAGMFDKAIADLDRVLKANPSRVDALIYRASAYRALNRLDPALADAEKAVKLAPDSVPGLLERGNIRRLKGDLDGARHDWVRIGMLAPGSPADRAAKDNIEHLELKEDKPPARPGG